VLAAQAAGVSGEDGFIAAHVRHTVDLVLDRSRELAGRLASRRAAVVGLTYRLAEGTVTSRGPDLPGGTAVPAVAATPGHRWRPPPRSPSPT
jgi:carbonic anhydrase